MIIRFDRGLWFGGGPRYRSECLKAIKRAIASGKIKRSARCQRCGKRPKRPTLPTGAELTAAGLKVACWLCTKCFFAVRNGTTNEVELI
jgi:hypothetical protein